MMDGIGEDREDDVIADLTYREKKGGGRARMEILQSLGDGLRVDERRGSWEAKTTPNSGGAGVLERDGDAGGKSQKEGRKGG
mmetsp:Transcript_11767/g.23447  ORF Transcript_11767/g.23447 Transcript_11767/m.23447 type:complete len:82 (-) Transcript_11767:1032-1277(-)